MLKKKFMSQKIKHWTMLRNMSNDEYVKHVWQIHEWMKDENEWGKREIPLKADMDSQRIWSDRLVSANAKDYMSLMEKINNRNYFTQQMQGEIENIFKGTVGNSNVGICRTERWFYGICIDK